MAFVGIVMIVSIITNEILGISCLFPPIIPLGGIDSLYMLAYRERTPDLPHLIPKAMLLDIYTANRLCHLTRSMPSPTPLPCMMRLTIVEVMMWC